MAAQTSRFLIHSPFPNTVSQDPLGTLLLTAQYLCDLQNAMPRHWSLINCHPTFPKDAEDFTRGGKYPKDVSLPTLLAYVQPV